MSHPLLGLSAVVLYLAAAGRIIIGHRVAAEPRPVKVQAAAIGAIAIAIHALLLYQGVITAAGVNLGVFNAASLVALIMAVVLLTVALFYPVEALATVLLPGAALSLLLALLFPSARTIPSDTPVGLDLHIALAIVAYSLVAIASLQAIFLGLAEYKLRHHHPIMRFLPPLRTMEVILFQITGIAFALLTLSLLLGLPYTRDVMAQHLVHKIVFSSLAWVVFAVLLWGRWRYGWRGQVAVRYVVVGTLLLALAFFGSNIVLELILNRV